MDWPVILLLMLGALTGLLLIGLPVAFAFIAVNIVGAWFVLGGENGLVQMTRNAASRSPIFSWRRSRCSSSWARSCSIPRWPTGPSTPSSAS
jgi:hypothetical protein